MLNRAIIKEIDHGWAFTLTIEYLQRIKKTGVVPLGVAEPFSKNNKGECYIKIRRTHDCSLPGPSWLLVKKSVQRESLQPCFYCFLPAQDSTHDLCNAKQMACKTNPYRKNRPGRSLPPDTCKHENRIGMHCNSWRARFSLLEVTLWHHTHTRWIYEGQWSRNITRQQSTSRSVLGHK